MSNTNELYEILMNDMEYDNSNDEYVNLTLNELNFIKSELTNINNFKTKNRTIQVSFLVNDEMLFYMCIYNDKNLGLCMRIYPRCIKDKKFKDMDAAVYFESFNNENSYFFSEDLQEDFKKIAYSTLNKSL